MTSWGKSLVLLCMARASDWSYRSQHVPFSDFCSAKIFGTLHHTLYSIQFRQQCAALAARCYEAKHYDGGRTQRDHGTTSCSRTLLLHVSSVPDGTACTAAPPVESRPGAAAPRCQYRPEALHPCCPGCCDQGSESCPAEPRLSGSRTREQYRAGLTGRSPERLQHSARYGTAEAEDHIEAVGWLG